MNTSMLVKRYTDYKQKNAQIKARQKVEREQELLPYLEDIGAAVADLRADGTSVVDQAEAVTNKNRNFLYAALRAFDVKQAELTEEAPAEPQGWVEPSYRVYTQTQYPNSRFVDIIGQGDYELTLTDGVVDDYPESWVFVDDPDQKLFYKRIIAEVERAATTE